MVYTITVIDEVAAIIYYFLLFLLYVPNSEKAFTIFFMITAKQKNPADYAGFYVNLRPIYLFFIMFITFERNFTKLLKKF